MSDSMRNDFNEQDLAQQTLRALEAKSGGKVDDSATSELGQLLRESAVHELPESNSDLRELLQQQSFAEPDANSLPIASTGTSSRIWRLSAIAASLVCVFGLGYLLFRDPVSVAELNATPDAGLELKVDQPQVVYRHETRTAQVPVQRTRLETKTRTVPTQKMRTETRTRQSSDGTSERYEVQVPYTENVTQNYQVEVPYTENVTQNYQVEVPYTADGKKIAKEDFEKYGVDVSRGEAQQSEKWTPPPTPLQVPDADNWLANKSAAGEVP